ncbi:hypothetical protein KY285_016601 [Solanum tuberosum]|nr:hypothetical protein KY284_016611 [Solanum tuberosum]KAH0702323.1 hypothetical protein KY285_016601 [Solanum tuberosum]
MEGLDDSHALQQEDVLLMVLCIAVEALFLSWFLQKQDDKHSPRSNLSAKSSSPDSLGFGRSLSKKFLDMAIRHMDIRQRVSGNLHPLMTNIPASSMYSVRSGPPTRGRTSRSISMPDSPLATSSNASSEVSVSNNVVWVDGSEIDEDISSDKGARSPASVRGR